MSSLTSGYQATRLCAGWRELASRGLIEATGPDRVVFLHNMISNDVEGLAPGEVRAGTLLTPTGKMIAVFSYSLQSDAVWLSLDRQRVTIVLDSLNNYIIMDDVELEDRAESFSTFGIQGPRAGEIGARLFSEDPPEEGRFKDVRFVGGVLRWLASPWPGGGSFEIIAPRPSAQGLTEALEGLGASGVEAVDRATWNLLQLEAGRPRFGVDVDETSNPLEAGLLEAISFEKGCYVGQEVIGRATHIGGVPRRLVRVMPAAGEALEAGSELLGAGGGRRVGSITSIGWSPANDAWIGLARIRSRFSEPDSRLEAEDPDGARIEVRVVERFPAEAEKRLA